MTKLCGFVGARSDRLTITDTVETMANALRHCAQVNDRFVWFEGGGMAVLSTHTPAGDFLGWDITASRCLGLAGNIVEGPGRARAASASGSQALEPRSEERRVGKECRSR